MTYKRHSHPYPRRAASWRRIGDRWYLVAGHRTVACLLPTSCGWLSSGLAPPSNGWNAVDFLTLQQGKACIERWWAMHHTFRQFEHHTVAEPYFS